MIKTFVNTLLFCVFSNAFQTFAGTGPEVVNATGGTISKGSWVIDYSIGEVVASTATAVDGAVTLGFLQPADQPVITSLVEEMGMNESKVYPNPAQDFLYLQANGQKIASAQIYAMDGQELAREENPSASLYIGDLKAGVYYLGLTGDLGQKIAYIKIIKQ